MDHFTHNCFYIEKKLKIKKDHFTHNFHNFTHNYLNVLIYFVLAFLCLAIGLKYGTQILLAIT